MEELQWQIGKMETSKKLYEAATHQLVTFLDKVTEQLANNSSGYNSNTSVASSHLPPANSSKHRHLASGRRAASSWDISQADQQARSARRSRLSGGTAYFETDAHNSAGELHSATGKPVGLACSYREGTASGGGGRNSRLSLAANLESAINQRLSCSVNNLGNNSFSELNARLGRPAAVDSSRLQLNESRARGQADEATGWKTNGLTEGMTGALAGAGLTSAKKCRDHEARPRSLCLKRHGKDHHHDAPSGVKHASRSEKLGKK